MARASSICFSPEALAHLLHSLGRLIPQGRQGPASNDVSSGQVMGETLLGGEGDHGLGALQGGSGVSSVLVES
jgi:hypothetical protein